MLDIDFYMKFHTIKKYIFENGVKDPDTIFNLLEGIRNRVPVIYNIETTNKCNMRCKMCPRTNLMTRKIEDLTETVFESIANQISPHSDSLWDEWVTFCKENYHIAPDDEPSENHFFLYVISDVIQLHGFGEPVLDKNIAKYIKILSDRGIKTYFSTNPININYERTLEMMSNGLSYIKYCFDGIDDKDNQEIRGKANDFSVSYEKVKKVLELKRTHNFSTTIVITMINLDKESQEEEYNRLKELFSGEDVYIYLKSENSQWYRQHFHGTKAIHGSEICKHPWMTMSIKSNGEVAMCMDDYNNEIILGDARTETLESIWNNDKYREFRMSHIKGNNEKCCNRCDLPVLGNRL